MWKLPARVKPVYYSSICNTLKRLLLKFAVLRKNYHLNMNLNFVYYNHSFRDIISRHSRDRNLTLWNFYLMYQSRGVPLIVRKSVLFYISFTTQKLLGLCLTLALRLSSWQYDAANCRVSWLFAPASGN